MTTFRTIDKANRIYAADETVLIGARYHSLHFRIDGRGDTYRVDCMKPLSPMWVAIDGGQGFKRLADAKSHVRQWIKAAKEQKDLTPRIEKDSAE